MFCGLLIILLHIFELWIHLQTVPPTIELSRHTSRGQRLWRVFAHWIALLPVLFDSLKLDGVKQVGLTPEAPDSNHTLTWHSGLLYCGAGDYFLDSLAGFGRGDRGKYEAGPEWWWSWSRPVIEANWELWETRCNHRHPVDMKKAWDCLRPSLWLYYRRQRTECWIWKRWACSSKPFVVS